MIEVEARVARRRIDRLAEELRYVNSQTFLRSLGLKTKSEEALSFLRSWFPSSASGSGSPSNLNEFGMPLEKGFFAQSYVSGSKIGFLIGHSLSNNTRATTVLNALDQGSRAHEVNYSDPVHFLGEAAKMGKGSSTKAKMLWVTLSGSVHYHRREGAHYTERTREFLETYILTEIKSEFATKVENRMRRIN